MVKSTLGVQNTTFSTTVWIVIIPHVCIIATYDVQGIQVMLVSDNAVAVASHFIYMSQARGVLYAFIYIGDSETVDFERSVYIPVVKSVAENGTLFLNISRGNYSVFAYDIEFTGNLQNSSLPAAIIGTIQVPGEVLGELNNVIFVYYK